MAYDTLDLFNKAKDAIEKHKLFFIEDIVAFLPCTKQTFYDHFPVKSDEIDELKEMLDKNKIEIKTSMRSKWYKSNAPALQMALYKLAATPEEHKLLQMNYQDLTSDGKRILPKIEWENGDTSEL
jgi:hypothetical protein